MTPFQMRQQHPYRGPIGRFGTSVLGRRPHANDLPKLQERWRLGIWVGLAGDSGEHILLCEDEMVKSDSVKVMEDGVDLPRMIR